MSIKNSKFLNSRATVTGGAIIAKYFPRFDEDLLPLLLKLVEMVFTLRIQLSSMLLLTNWLLRLLL